MSNTAKAGGPSVDPLFTIVIGSMLVTSPALSQVRVPPGWMSVRGAVDAVVVTLAMPLMGAAATPFWATEVRVVFLEVVAVEDLAVVPVVPPAAAVVGVAPAPAAAVVVVDRSVVASVEATVVDVSAVAALVFLELPPPH